MEEKIFFNDLYKTDQYLIHLKYLLSDYELFKKKHFSNLILEKLRSYYPYSDLFLTHSATGALEMIATLIDVKEGDEIIMPSFTYVSTANAFVSKGATPVFIDINPETLNIDEKLIEQAITSKTKAIVAVHYAGHACNMNAIKEIANKYSLFLIEDAAMGFGSKYGDNYLGSIADFGVVSFDITKHINAIQGGLLLVNNKQFKNRANNIYHIGTNRSAFENGEATYYEWTDIGSKYQMNELNATVLFAQLNVTEDIFKKRKELSKLYYNELKELENLGKLRLMPEELVAENIHEFYIVLNTQKERDDLSEYLKSKGIEALFHYIPLHSSPFGKKISKFIGTDFTSNLAKRLLRLPLHENLTNENAKKVCILAKEFLK